MQYKQVYSEGLTTKNITFVTYNACTLGKTDDSQQHKCGFDKAPFLASQFEQVHIVGIQEARTPQGDSILIGQHSVWYRISGGKTSSKSGGSILGNELWIKLSLPFAHVNEKPAFFKKDDMTIVFKHPRLLAVRITNKHIDMYAVVEHSPHTASSESDRSAFWKLLSQVLEGKHPVVLLIDANARIGEITSAAVSDIIDPDTPDNNGILNESGYETCKSARSFEIVDVPDAPKPAELSTLSVVNTSIISSGLAGSVTSATSFAFFVRVKITLNNVETSKIAKF